MTPIAPMAWSVLCFGPMAKRSDADLDRGRLDEAMGLVLEVMRAEFPEDKSGQYDDLQRARLKFLASNRFEGAKALVALLERRAKLLGLDARDEATSGTGESTVERMTRQIRERSSS